MFRNFILISFLFLLSACAGTGTKSIPVSITKPNNTNDVTLYFSRPSVYVGGGIIPTIFINGSEVGKLGSGEYIETIIPKGSFNIELKTQGLNSIGMIGTSLTGNGSSGSRFFYIVSMRSGLLTSTWVLTETTEQGFKNSQK